MDRPLITVTLIVSMIIATSASFFSAVAGSCTASLDKTSYLAPAAGHQKLYS